MEASPTFIFVESLPSLITASVSEIARSSSRSWLTTTIAEPRAARSTRLWWMAAAAPASTPQVGCETTSTSGICKTSRPMMNFCRLPPESEPAVAAGPVALTPKARMISSA